MWRRNLVSAILVALAFYSSASADVIVSVGNLNLMPGGTGFVDVTVSGNSDLLQSFGLEFRIRTSDATELDFADPQPYDYLTDSGYVLFGNSFASANPPVGNVCDTDVPRDTFIGGDMTMNAPNVKVTDTKLLVRLQVTTDTLLPPEVGNSFTISLEPSSSTYFSDSALNSIAYTATAGTVSIVPEPGTMTLLFVSAGFLMLGRLLQRQSGKFRAF
jgi:hypothetical protein